MTRLNYAEVTGVQYVTSDAGIVLAPEQQSLAVQALSVYRELYNWTDADTSGDDIEALVASTLQALLDTTIPPKENMNNHILLYPYMGTITSGNPFLFTTAGAWQQNAPTNGSAYHIDDVMLAAGDWRLIAYVFRQNSAGILRIDVKDAATGTTIDSDSDDLYSSTTAIGAFVVNTFTLADDTLVDLFVSAFGKNASSSNYALPVLSFALVRD